VVAAAVAAFERIFGARPTACGIGPGRVEILGNHTDYNGGCVLTAAIDRRIVMAGRACPGDVTSIHSLAMGSTAGFSARQPVRDPDVPWADYVKGVIAVLRDAGAEVPAFEAVIADDLPMGSGLGSSAALETATAHLIGALTGRGRSASLPTSFAGVELQPTELARLLQRAEDEFVGVHCGILDQFSSIHGSADQVIFLDCATLEHELIALGERAPAIVLCDTRAPRSLAAGRYNVRRGECERAARLLGESLGRPVDYLCEVTADELRTVDSRLPGALRLRVRHVIEENARVHQARNAIRAGRVEDLGRLMGASHESSRTNFQNSTTELDLLCRIAAEQPGCLGSRLCGAGWGGNTVNLVVPEAVESFRSVVAAAFQRATGREPAIHLCRAADGARSLRL
jgi:galactokinase